MTVKYRDFFLGLVKLLNPVSITLPFVGCWILYYAPRTVSSVDPSENILIIFIFFILYILLGKIYDGFLIPLKQNWELVYSDSLAFLMTDGIMYILILLLSKHLQSLTAGLICIVFQFTLAYLWVVLAKKWYFKEYPSSPTAIVYEENGDDYEKNSNLTRSLEQYDLDQEYDIQMIIPVSKCMEDLSCLDAVDNVILRDIHSHKRNTILKHCIAHNINVFLIPGVGDALMSSAQPLHMLHLPILRVGRYMASPEYLLLKRMMDIVVSLAAIILLSPVMLLVSLAVKLEDGGPVFYRQVRLTQNGKTFKILKFRSMRIDAEKDGVARLSSGKNDSRITKVGSFIRACRLDELPQLFNILEGSMSLVGPRCERPEIAEQYRKVLPEFDLRLQAKAGLTGYAQVYGKYNSTPYDKLQMDLMYLAHPSIFEDCKILLATVKILFMPESTEGVSEEQTTAMRVEKV